MLQVNTDRIMGQAHLDSMPAQAREAYERGNQALRERFRAEGTSSPREPIYASLLASADRAPDGVSEGRAFANLAPLQRARLSQADPKRYSRMRAAYFRERADIQGRMKAAKSHADYAVLRTQLEGLGTL